MSSTTTPHVLRLEGKPAELGMQLHQQFMEPVLRAALAAADEVQDPEHRAALERGLLFGCALPIFAAMYARHGTAGVQQMVNALLQSCATSDKHFGLH